jgi:hypothetical protein
MMMSSSSAPVGVGPVGPVGYAGAGAVPGPTTNNLKEAHACAIVADAAPDLLQRSSHGSDTALGPTTKNLLRCATQRELTAVLWAAVERENADLVQGTLEAGLAQHPPVFSLSTQTLVVLALRDGWAPECAGVPPSAEFEPPPYGAAVSIQAIITVGRMLRESQPGGALRTHILDNGAVMLARFATYSLRMYLLLLYVVGRHRAQHPALNETIHRGEQSFLPLDVARGHLVLLHIGVPFPFIGTARAAREAREAREAHPPRPRPEPSPYAIMRAAAPAAPATQQGSARVPSALADSVINLKEP